MGDRLMKNKRGKVVSKKSSAFGKRAYQHIQDWVASVVAARKALQVTGFVAIKVKHCMSSPRRFANHAANLRQPPAVQLYDFAVFAGLQLLNKQSSSQISTIRHAALSVA